MAGGKPAVSAYERRTDCPKSTELRVQPSDCPQILAENSRYSVKRGALQHLFSSGLYKRTDPQASI